MTSLAARQASISAKAAADFFMPSATALSKSKGSALAGRGCDASFGQLLGYFPLGEALSRLLQVEAQGEVGVALAIAAQFAARTVALQLAEAKVGGVGTLRLW